jgi:hypothetical protein
MLTIDFRREFIVSEFELLDDIRIQLAELLVIGSKTGVNAVSRSKAGMSMMELEMNSGQKTIT